MRNVLVVLWVLYIFPEAFSLNVKGSTLPNTKTYYSYCSFINYHNNDDQLFYIRIPAVSTQMNPNNQKLWLKSYSSKLDQKNAKLSDYGIFDYSRAHLDIDFSLAGLSNIHKVSALNKYKVNYTSFNSKLGLMKIPVFTSQINPFSGLHYCAQKSQADFKKCNYNENVYQGTSTKDTTGDQVFTFEKDVLSPVGICDEITLPPCTHRDFKSLMHFYCETNGAQWTNNYGWKEGWAGSSCDPCNYKGTPWYGIKCHLGRVICIDLDGIDDCMGSAGNGNNLSGKLPALMQDLSSLSILNLSNNNISGYIPNSLCAGLTRLDLRKNKFIGTFPELYQLKLKELYLSNNTLSGRLPNFQTPNLEFLELNNNDFNSIIPVFDIKKLKSLDISNNKLTGYIPDLNMPELYALNLSGNKLTGNIPLFEKTNLHFLELDNNRLYGGLPDLKLRNLEKFYVNNNDLAGCIPSSYYKFCDSVIVDDIFNKGKKIKVKPSVSFKNNLLLPWKGDFDTFCATDGSLQAQLGAPCDNQLITDGNNDVIKDDCYCETQMPDIKTSPIIGKIFVDINSNGIFDNDDLPAGNYVIQLMKGCVNSELIASTVSDDYGNYTFSHLPPGYYMVKLKPDVYGSVVSTGECCLEVISKEPYIPVKCDFALQPPNCSPNPYSADNICEAAIPLCDLTVIGQFPCSQNPSELGPWFNASHCSGVYHNTSFYRFYAGSGNYTIQITVFNCAGHGIQYGIMDSCNPGGPFITCNGLANNGTITIPSDILTPCQEYIFWIDGFGGAVCSYYVQVTGVWESCPIPSVQDLAIITECDPICPSNKNYLPVKAFVEKATEESISGMIYSWELNTPYGELKYETDVNTTLVRFFTNGEYKICVSTYHPCTGSADRICKSITIKNLEDVDFGTFRAYKFPWQGPVDENGQALTDIHGNLWLGGEITLEEALAGQVNRKVTDTCNCTYTQSIRIIPQKIIRDTINLALCQSELPFMYNDLTISGSLENFEYLLPGDYSDADEVFINIINAEILNVAGRIVSDCTKDSYKLRFIPEITSWHTLRDSVLFIWKDSMGNKIQDMDNEGTDIEVAGNGEYTMQVTAFKNDKSCLSDYSHTFISSDLMPDVPVDYGWPLKISKSNDLATYRVWPPNLDLTYLWSYPPTAQKVKDDSTSVLRLYWSGPNGGTVCVKARNICGDSPDKCLTVRYIKQKDPVIGLDSVPFQDPATACVHEVGEAKYSTMTAPEAAYGRALLAYLTGEQIEPQINYTLVPRTIAEKTKQVKEEVQILPNPAQDYLSINIKNRSNKSQYSYELYTITGQKVMQGQLKDQNELNISLLAQGLYFISINKDGLRFKSQKIIIQK